MPDSTGVLNIPCASPQPYDDLRGYDNADSIVMDPLDDDFYYNYWNRIATSNTKIYRSLFRCVPDDTGMSCSSPSHLTHLMSNLPLMFHSSQF